MLEMSSMDSRAIALKEASQFGSTRFYYGIRQKAVQWLHSNCAKKLHIERDITCHILHTYTHQKHWFKFEAPFFSVKIGDYFVIKYYTYFIKICWVNILDWDIVILTMLNIFVFCGRSTDGIRVYLCQLTIKIMYLVSLNFNRASVWMSCLLCSLASRDLEWGQLSHLLW